MRKTFIFAFFAIVATIGFAQESEAIKEKLKAKYDYVKYDSFTGDNNYGFYTVVKNDKYGVCDANGKEIIAPKKYTGIFKSWVGDGYQVKIGDYAGWCDLLGKEIVAPQKYDFAIKWEREDYISVTMGDLKGACNLQGKEIMPCRKYEQVIQLGKTQLIKYKINGKYGAIDLTGKEIFPSKYDDIDAGESVILLKSANKYGYADCKGNIIIDFQYETAESFKDGVAMVSKDGSSFLISNPLKDGGSKTLSVLSTKDGQRKSAVDTDIPLTSLTNSETFVFIIANENYQDLHVPFAINDGTIFKEYCQKTLGIPEKNIRYVEDATLGTVRSIINRMKEIADAFDGDAKIIFYYSGQGISDEKNNQAYLMPTDGYEKNIPSTCYSLAQLNETVGALNVKSAIVLLDACFNGAKRDGKMLASGRGVAIKVKNDAVQGKTVLFNASSTDENAQSFTEEGHGLFTYYLLKKLQETKGKVSLKELSDYITSNVKKQSLSSGKNQQTPKITVSDSIIQQWQNINF